MSNQNSKPNSKWDKVSLYISANKEEIMQPVYLFSSTQRIKEPHWKQRGCYLLEIMEIKVKYIDVIVSMIYTNIKIKDN